MLAYRASGVKETYAQEASYYCCDRRDSRTLRLTLRAMKLYLMFAIANIRYNPFRSLSLSPIPKIKQLLKKGDGAEKRNTSCAFLPYAFLLLRDGGLVAAGVLKDHGAKFVFRSSCWYVDHGNKAP